MDTGPGCDGARTVFRSGRGAGFLESDSNAYAFVLFWNDLGIGRTYPARIGLCIAALIVADARMYEQSQVKRRPWASRSFPLPLTWRVCEGNGMTPASASRRNFVTIVSWGEAVRATSLSHDALDRRFDRKRCPVVEKVPGTPPRCTRDRGGAAARRVDGSGSWSGLSVG